MVEQAADRHSTREWLKALGEQLRERRISAGLTQEDLAHRSDVSLSTVRHLEQGAGGSLTTFVRVARALGASDWLSSLSPARPAISPLEIYRAQQGSAGVPRRVRKRRP
ncbi:MAG: helix-turn-helix transcriptional regulator [Acidimicrobiales bacterium]